ARMEAGAMPYRKNPIHLTEVISGLADDFAQEFGRNGFRLEVSTMADGLVVRGDREALGQAIWNLLENAVKYSLEEKTVQMETVRKGSRASLLVGLTDGGEPRALLRLPAGERIALRHFSIRWTGDGRYIFLTKVKGGDEPSEIWRIPAQGGDPVFTGISGPWL